MQFIAYLTGNPAIQGYNRRDFKWMPEHKCYVYLGRAFTEKEFNAVMPVIWKKYREVYPQYRILEEAPSAPVPAAPTEPALPPAAVAAPVELPAPAALPAPTIVSSVVIEPPAPVPEKRQPAPRPARVAALAPK